MLKSALLVSQAELLSSSKVKKLLLALITAEIILRLVILSFFCFTVTPTATKLVQVHFI